MKRIVFFYLCLFVMITCLVACDKTSYSKGEIIDDSNLIEYEEVEPSDLENIVYDLEKINSSVVNGSQKFAFDIFKKLNEEDMDESIFISPFSISQALTMTYNGAERSTKEGMEKTLGLSGLDRILVNESYRNLSSFLVQIDEKIDLNIGNSIWIRDGLEIKDDFIQTNEENFDAEVEAIDFSDDKSVDIINEWIKNATNDMITKMLEPPIREDIIMYLINAIYFKGEWSEQFDPELTYQDDFTTFEGDVQTVNMMRKAGSVEYVGIDEFKAVRLPYGNRKTSMYIILPSEGTNINEFINDMTIEKWRGITKTVLEKEDIVFRIPRFKLEYGTKELKDSLISLGMEEAFGYNADFSGISEDILISSVKHRAVIEVNEEGSEAAGVTIEEVKCTGVADPITFIANRPFMFIINDDVMDTILFMGKVVSIEE